jgi:hypothetical protein
MTVCARAFSHGVSGWCCRPVGLAQYAALLIASLYMDELQVWCSGGAQRPVDRQRTGRPVGAVGEGQATSLNLGAEAGCAPKPGRGRARDLRSIGHRRIGRRPISPGQAPMPTVRLDPDGERNARGRSTAALHPRRPVGAVQGAAGAMSPPASRTARGGSMPLVLRRPGPLCPRDPPPPGHQLAGPAPPEVSISIHAVASTGRAPSRTGRLDNRRRPGHG